MKILFCDFSSDALRHSWVTLNYQDELQRAGYTLAKINPRNSLGASQSRDAFDDFIVDSVKQENSRGQVDIFFSSVRDNEMSPDAVTQIRQLGVRTVNATWDNVLVPHRVKSIAKAFDIYWVHEPDAVDTIKGYGARVFHVPIAANPHVYYPSSSIEDVEVSFCGTSRESRPVYIEKLADEGIPVDVYGPNWKSPEGNRELAAATKRPPLRKTFNHVAGSLTHQHGRTVLSAALLRCMRRSKIDYSAQTMIEANSHGPLSFPDMVALFSRSKISLGFNELGHTYLLKKPLLQVRLRDFEAPMSGGCHIMHRMPIMQEQFEEDKEMLFYSSVEELTEKIRYYLDVRRDTERLKIKQRARERAIRDHTWMHRFSRLFKELDLDG